ncbi:MAG: 2,4-dienoyl-CoA reductase-like NADH-dependent reductase (Old Yellow Enzyme family) [Planctomycetota bacterium]|jgi:2,4-dienoyl-CoA reductase-like NADH-dependent reductase (Old Yellow Enzyme family)
MTVTSAFDPLTFSHGRAMKNRFMLAPLTNEQSHDDGTLSEDEYKWLTMRAQGGFGGTMTCASHVQAIGRGFPGQLGIFGDEHLEGLTRLAAEIRAKESLAFVQLHHAGMRSPEKLIGQTPVCPSENKETGARALTLREVELLTEDFIAGAVRAERAGFDGVEIHGAHGYILGQFFSAELNQRRDIYGGSFENRTRILFDIIDGVRERCGSDLTLGVRLSPERFGVVLDEVCELSQRLMTEAKIDFLDVSLWDVFKEPEDKRFKGRSLLSFFTDLDRGEVRLGAAGKIYGSADVRACLEAGVDFVMPGRAAVLHHDFPLRVQADDAFKMIQVPVTADYLRSQGLGDSFVEYMSRWKGFVEG